MSTATTTATLGRAFQKARASINGTAKLENLLASLRELEAKRLGVEKFYRDAFAKWNSVEGRLSDEEAKYRKALTSRDLTGVDEAVAVLPLLRAQVDHARNEAANLHRYSTVGIGFGQFTQENPKAREILSTAVKGTLTVAEQEAASVLRKEKEHLQGWDADAISASPKIRGANARVKQLTALLQRIESAETLNQMTWQSCVSELLE